MRDARRERRAERRRRQAERQAERRRAAGAQPRAVYEGRSAERIKPWTIEGVSRRTWYRRRLPIQPQSIRLTQLDGKLPNLALMKLAYHHRQRGDEIYFTKHVERGLWEPDYQRVYGSAIFSHSAERVAAFKQHFPEAIVGGTYNVLDNTTRRRSGSTRAKSMTIQSIRSSTARSASRSVVAGCGAASASCHERKVGRALSTRSHPSGGASRTRAICICSTMIFSGNHASSGKRGLRKSAAAASRFV
jgi:hypothetical protein